MVKFTYEKSSDGSKGDLSPSKVAEILTPILQRKIDVEDGLPTQTARTISRLKYSIVFIILLVAWFGSGKGNRDTYIGNGKASREHFVRVLGYNLPPYKVTVVEAGDNDFVYSNKEERIAAMRSRHRRLQEMLMEKQEQERFRRLYNVKNLDTNENLTVDDPIEPSETADSMPARKGEN